MSLSEFLNKTEFSKQNEIRRSLLISFFNLRVSHISSFSTKELCVWLEELGYPRPNAGRLSTNLKASKMFVTAKADGVFKIHPATLETLDSEYPELSFKTENVIAHDSIIPESLIQKERAFVTSLIKQINASYENNIYDGCAVLMRRLIEILLILSYQEAKIEASIIGNGGDYKQLNVIIDDAKLNKVLNFSRNTKEHLETFRKLGNFSAHKIYYNANRKAIETTILDYKAVIEELLYKSGLRT